jgi:hypothetical protein
VLVEHQTQTEAMAVPEAVVVMEELLERRAQVDKEITAAQAVLMHRPFMPVVEAVVLAQSELLVILA